MDLYYGGTLIIRNSQCVTDVTYLLNGQITCSKARQ